MSQLTHHRPNHIREAVASPRTKARAARVQPSRPELDEGKPASRSTVPDEGSPPGARPARQPNSCRICGGATASYCLGSDDVALCASCTEGVLPRAIARAVLGYPGGFAWARLEDYLNGFVRDYWKAAALGLQAELADRDDENSGDDC